MQLHGETHPLRIAAFWRQRSTHVRGRSKSSPPLPQATRRNHVGGGCWFGPPTPSPLIPVEDIRPRPADPGTGTFCVPRTPTYCHSGCRGHTVVCTLSHNPLESTGLPLPDEPASDALGATQPPRSGLVNRNINFGYCCIRVLLCRERAGARILE